MIKENTTAKVYEINNKGEYGTFVFLYQEKYLEIICHTSFGAYGYTWSSPGSNAYSFLLNMSYDTFINKMTQGKQYVLDNEKQEKLMNDVVDSLAPLNNWSEEEVGYYKQLVEEVVYCGTRTAEDFKSQLVHSELFEQLYQEEYENIETIEKVDDQLEGLWKQLWLPLIEKLQQENTEMVV